MCECSSPNDVSLWDYQNKLRRKFLHFIDSLRKTPPVKNCPVSVGDTVTFTNEFGVAFEGFKVIGFAENAQFYGRYIHISKASGHTIAVEDYGSYWFPVRPDELALEPTAAQLKDLEWF